MYLEVGVAFGRQSSRPIHGRRPTPDVSIAERCSARPARGVTQRTGIACGRLRVLQWRGSRTGCRNPRSELTVWRYSSVRQAGTARHEGKPTSHSETRARCSLLTPSNAMTGNAMTGNSKRGFPVRFSSAGCQQVPKYERARALRGPFLVYFGGICSSSPGWMRSGFGILARFASQISFHRSAWP